MKRLCIAVIVIFIGLFGQDALVFAKSAKKGASTSNISPEEDLGFDDPAFSPDQEEAKPSAKRQKNEPPPATSRPTNVQNAGIQANAPENISEPNTAIETKILLQPPTENPAMDSDATVAPLMSTVAPPAPPAPSADPTPMAVPASVAVPAPPPAPVPAPLAEPVKMVLPVSADVEIVATKVGEANEFAGAPLIPGTLRNVADGEAPEEYIVESGDTLFDVCSQLLAEGGYWPKLWSVNPQIKNPHFIWPGMRLAFYSGDTETPPFLQVVAEEDLIPIDKGNLVEEQLLHGKVPDMDKAFEIQKTDVIDSKDLTDAFNVESQLAVVGALFDPTSRKVTLPGFIFASEKEAAGIVIGGVEGEAMIGEGRQALAESGHTLPIGTTYTVLRAESHINSPKTGDEVGYFYSFVANVRVLSNIPSKDISMIEVVQSRLGIERNDILVPFISTSRTLPLGNDVGAISNIVGNVVAFEHEGQLVGGEGSMLFVDKGNKAGISTGQFYKVFSTPGFLATSEISKDLEGVELPVAVIKIIDTTDAGSVGFIVKNTKEVHLGDSLDRG